MTAPVLTRVLPTLVANNKTRTGNEALIYYNPGKAVLIGRIVCTDSTHSVYVPEQSCAGALLVPSGAIGALRVARLTSTTDLVFDASGSNITVSKDSPIGQSFEIGQSSPVWDPTTYTGQTVTGGAAGDTLEVWLLPDVANDVLICYDTGFQTKPGNVLKPIPRKLNPVDHFVQQRPENSISMSEIYVSNLKGLQKIRGKDVTLIAKMFPDNAGLPAELRYYTTCILNPDFQTPSDGNESVVSSVEGNFNKDLTFSA